MLGMLLERGALHHDVVQVHDHKTVEEWLKPFVHKYAESGGCIGEPKWPNNEFERPVFCYTRCFALIFLGNTNLVVPKAQVKFGEVQRFPKLVKKMRY